MTLLAKHDLRCAAATCEGAMCSSKLRCACVRCILRLAKCDRIIASYFGNNERHWLSFGVSYNFVAQKWKILAILKKKIFGQIAWKVLGFKTML
jgi:hypothetical protein